MKAFVILGGNNSSRKEKIKELYHKLKPENILELDPDVQIFENQNSIGIEEVRELERILSLKPFAKPPKIAIIQAELLTTEAQTALLKTLEEPPGETIFFLHAPNGNLLLPTILSRCQTVQLPAESEIQLTDEELKTNDQRLNQLLKTSPVQRLLLADEWGINKNKEEATKFCQIQLILWREILIGNFQLPPRLDSRVETGPTSTVQLPISNLQLLNNLKLITKTLRYLNANVNVKLAIDNLLLSFQ